MTATLVEQKTTDYNLFSFLNNNRLLNRNHINKLKEAISEEGYKVYLPILVNEHFEIVDGQHRFVACKEMGLPIYYTIIHEGNEIKALLDMNNLNLSWSSNDYVHHYASEHNQNYIRLENLTKELGLTARTCIIIASHKNIDGGGYLSRAIKEGNIKFALDDSLKVKCFASNMEKLLTALGTRLKKSTRLITALLKLSQARNFKWETLISKAEKYPTMTYPCRTSDEFYEMLVRLYNHNIRRQENKIER